ncbi:MAG: M23 peptidase domain protein [Candidatus Falkowbacteria bacterium GW2011_GWD2_38_42]|uniref:M23 peptidase domain protein n=1 Tax=Candidatus Falkowbacteria bacterium GW2011_GWE1_38_31 TaxID=1618638 RepID=A0A0G0MBJ4_9BACT|nr:MAG: M23 peptidase domain protein [Candidatus Falkowbacteria bacterium GW2011_GWF2_38_1205]KKQ63994.1 MAG: M23 peptidase domain protein [Candidatus Falkowbacteria bacterium GW2011_GWF1_38_22]KKQ66658.1 MAG: M23 peptidase domain protein [Candidatus Falkowbacteria bacterium GW2011_GWE2_38_254]KKQ71099.1 MAG: M23 peptidase domain protein [Candidatus Falkowbacteria bacterium GW2011_GWE1_38_31]KKQ73225.1 MAG: M23 peptidase domain protein [Candidatus Falkowbacteria bacterium GW2011_GWD2_38_42]
MGRNLPKRFFDKEEIGQINDINTEVVQSEEKIISLDRIEKIEISENSTYGALMATSGVEYALAMEIYDDAKNVYDLVKIRVGRHLELVYDRDTDELKELRYKIDTEDELHVRNVKYLAQEDSAASSTEKALDKKWQAKIEPIPYEIRQKTVEGTVESSMYQAALDNNIDIRAIIELADAFQWTIDFSQDPRVGDTFKFVYEERYLDGEYVMPGKIFAGRYTNDGTEYYVYYFEESESNKGFFDKDGNSVQKMFLKAPVAFKYISSPFTTGQRYIEAFNVSTGHRAVDYAAAIGTPIRAVGDGTVTFAGWSSAGYGNLTSIRHNATYSTNYAHQSKFAVKKGQKVKQGQIIGYVGSTGFSTGPHLHYEMVKNGAKVNPLREVLPPGEPIKTENRGRFEEVIGKWVGELK